MVVAVARTCVQCPGLNRVAALHMAHHAGVGPDDRDISCGHALGACDRKLLAKPAEGDVAAAQHAGRCTKDLGGAEVHAEQLALVQICVPAGREADIPDVRPLKAQIKCHIRHHILIGCTI